MLRSLSWAVTGVFYLSSAVVFGCTVSPFPPPPICERFWEGDAVALVEVTDIHESKSNHRTVTLRVLDTFRGDPPLELTIKDPWTTCGVSFGKKAQYLAWLFYDKEKGTWTAYGDRAAYWGGKDSTSEDLRYAQSMKRPPTTGRIFGTLDKRPEPRFGAIAGIQPLPTRSGAIVVATGSAGASRSVVSSDSTFEIAALAPGKYTVTVLGLPATLSVIPESIEVRGGGCKEMYLFSGSSSEITGRVFGMGKQPEAAWIHLVPVGTSGTSRRDEQKVFADSETGVFSFKHVEPGKYVIGYELGHSPTLNAPYAARYYPDTTDIAAAKVFDVKDGLLFEGIEFNLGAEVARRHVRVRVTWADDSPVQKATAYLRDAHNPYSSVAEEQTETDENGEAVLEGFVDTDYDVNANAVCKGTVRTRDVREKVIPAGSSEVGVDLRVPGRKCVLVGNRYLEELEKLE